MSSPPPYLSIAAIAIAWTIGGAGPSEAAFKLPDNIGNGIRNVVSSARTRRPGEPCYVAFVHGSGHKYGHLPVDDGTIVNKIWSRGPDHLGTSFVHGANGSRSGNPANNCQTWVVGYDGEKHWAHAAADVAASLNQFVASAGIPARKLVVVTHSMGGLVMRFILNNGVPNAPFADPSFVSVARATRYAITVQAPHRGSEAADALFGEADVFIGNTGGLFGPLIGQDRTDARWSMRRSYVDGVNWGDAGRTAPLVLVGGTSTEAASRTTNESNESVRSDDDGLDKLRQLLCHKSGPLNGWGSQCWSSGWTLGLAWSLPGGFAFGSLINAAFQPSDVPGDGMVTAASAFGEKFHFDSYSRDVRDVEATCGGSLDEILADPGRFSSDCKPELIIPFLTQRAQASVSRIAGPVIPWFSVPLNHNHGRYNDMVTTITYKSGRAAFNRIGDEIGSAGLDLPCSDPELRAAAKVFGGCK